MTMAVMAGALAGGTRITLNASYQPQSTVAAGTATAQFELNSSGDINMTNGNNSLVDVGDWLLPKLGMSGFDCMLTLNSGTNPSGSAMATWLNLGTTRNWQISQSVLGINSNTCTLQIRNASTLVVLASSSINMIAERT